MACTLHIHTTDGDYDWDFDNRAEAEDCIIDAADCSWISCYIEERSPIEEH